MSSPFNQLPADPAWVEKVHKLTTALATELGSMVVLIAIQEKGKMSISCDGAPDEGPLSAWAKDLPTFLLLLASVCAQHEEHEAGVTRQ